MFIQFFTCGPLEDTGKVWMLLDPNECDQNAERILEVWAPVVKSIKHARRAESHPMLMALYCSFHKAHKLAAYGFKCSAEVTLWTAMAAVPASVVHIIAQKAQIAFV